MIFTLHVLYRQLYMEVNCIFLRTYTFILHLFVIFMPFYMNDSTAQVTHFSSTLPFRYTYNGLFFHFFLFDDAIAK